MPILRDVPGSTWVLFMFALIVVAGGILLMQAIAEPVSAEAVAAMVTAGLGVFAIHIGHVTGHQQAKATTGAEDVSTAAAGSRQASTRFATRPSAHRTSSEGESQMQREFEALTDLNQQIGDAESGGDKDSLKSLLAPVLAFRRVNGDCVDKQRFLDNVAESAPRETTIVALVNATSGPAEPPDTGLTPEEIGDELSRPVLEEEARQRCQQAREEIPDLNC